jgi:hypothetical protein
MELGKGQICPPLVCVEPAKIAKEGVIPARVVTRVEAGTAENARQALLLVVLTNFSHEPLTLPRSTAICMAEDVSENLIDQINMVDSSEVQVPEKPKRKRRDDVLYDRLLAGKLDHLTRRINRSWNQCSENTCIFSTTNKQMILRRRML